MCGPGVVMGLNALGTYQQIRAAKADAAYQASVANANATLAERQAVEAGKTGAYEQSQIRDKARKIEATQRAQIAASGLELAAGSPLNILADTAYQSEQDVQTSRHNTGMRMWELNNQANDYRAQAEAARRAGKNATRSLLLTGITSLAKQYKDFGLGNQKKSAMGITPR
jgi:hypothetical protein